MTRTLNKLITASHDKRHTIVRKLNTDKLFALKATVEVRAAKNDAAIGACTTRPARALVELCYALEDIELITRHYVVQTKI